MDYLRQFRAAPNLLTLLRLFIIPFLVLAILNGRHGLAFTLFVLAGFSDGLDGMAARITKQYTQLGLYLDPIADKLLLFATGTLRDFRPSLLGKFNTLVQILGLTMVLIEQVWPSVDGQLLRVGLLRSIAWLAPISAAQYAWIVVQRMSTPEPQAAK